MPLALSLRRHRLSVRRHWLSMRRHWLGGATGWAAPLAVIAGSTRNPWIADQCQDDSTRNRWIPDQVRDDNHWVRDGNH